MDSNLQKYRAFAAAVEQGSFTKAAQVLNYTQSGVSRMISDLEREWGLVLLERGKSGVRLTGDGRKLLPLVKNICGEHEKLLSRVNEMKGLKSGLIRIGSFSSAAAHWLPNIIREFQKDYPDIEYELLLGDYDEIEQWIREGKVDCGFLRLPAKGEMETIFLEQDRLLVVLPEGHPLAELEKIPVSAITEEPFLLLKNGENADALEIFGRSMSVPKVRFTSEDGFAVLAMVENGLGISILPELILKRGSRRIVSRELEIPVYRNLGIGWQEKQSASLAVKRFMEYLKYR